MVRFNHAYTTSSILKTAGVNITSAMRRYMENRQYITAAFSRSAAAGLAAASRFA